MYVDSKLVNSFTINEFNYSKDHSFGQLVPGQKLKVKFTFRNGEVVEKNLRLNQVFLELISNHTFQQKILRIII